MKPTFSLFNRIVKSVFICGVTFAGFTFIGCSAHIAANGKSYSYLLNHLVTMDEIHAQLGEPLWSKQYEVPIPIKDTFEFKNYYNLTKSEYAGPWEPFVEGAYGKSASISTTSKCEVFERLGPYYDSKRGDGYVLFSGLTLGLGEFWGIPQALSSQKEMAKKYFYLTFWYDQWNRFVGFFYGDVRDPQTTSIYGNNKTNPQN